MSLPRNWRAVAAHFRRGGPMKDRRSPRGGATNESRDLLDEYQQEQGDQAEDQDMSNDEFGDLDGAVEKLGHYLDELLYAPIRPSGQCTCYSEGTCDWCRAHCLQCGGTEEEHPVQSEGEAPHAFQRLCQCTGDVLCTSCQSICSVCGCGPDAHPVTQNDVDDWQLNCEPHNFTPPGD